MAPPVQLATMMPSIRTIVAFGGLLAGVLVTISLGNWQLRRAAEKLSLEQTWNAAQHAPAIDLNAHADFAAIAAHLPQHVRVAGQFEYARTIWLDNRPSQGRAGFLVVTPLRLSGSQERILVNRGWAPRDPAVRTRLPAIGHPDGQVVIDGLALATVPRVFQLGSSDVGSIRQNLDLDEMRAEIGAPLAGFVIQQSSSLDDSLDRRWLPPATGVDRHRGYAFQWFSLATVLGVILLGFAWRAARGRSVARTAA